MKPTAGDIVLIAGKGHEKVQVTSTGTVPFDDIEEATKALAGRRLRNGTGAGGKVMKLTLARAAEFMPATGEFAPEAVASGYSIDSRTLQPGDLFFAVRGERLDGHDYVEAALAKGAVAAVVEKQQAERFPSKSQLLVVERLSVGAAATGSSRPPSVGQAADRRDRLGWQDHDQGNHCARAGDAASRAEVAGQSQ